MDKMKTIQWVVTASFRGLAFVVGAWLGQDAVKQEAWTAAGEGIIAVIAVGTSLYTSIKGRKKLLATEPPA